MTAIPYFWVILMEYFDSRTNEHYFIPDTAFLFKKDAEESIEFGREASFENEGRITTSDGRTQRYMDVDVDVAWYKETIHKIDFMFNQKERDK